MPSKKNNFVINHNKCCACTIIALLYLFYALMSNSFPFDEKANCKSSITNIKFFEIYNEFIQPNRRTYLFENYDIKKAVITSFKDFPLYKTLFFHKQFSQEQQSLVYTGNDYTLSFDQSYVHAIFYERVDIYILNEAYIKGLAILGTQGYFYDIYNISDINDTIKAQKKHNKTYQMGFRYVIAPIVSCFPNFGDWIIEYFCPLMYIDEWIWDLNPVVCLPNVPQDLFDEYMKILGHDNVVLVDRNDDFVYGKTMFVIKGFTPKIPYGVNSLPLLAEKISNYYGLNKIIPKNYGYMNKKKRKRRITNMKKLISSIKRQYKINFIKLQVDHPNRTTFAKLMASLKLLLCPGGYIAYNILMMQSGTGFITLHSSCIEGPSLQIACHLNLWHIQVINSNIHRSKFFGPGNLTRVSYSFKIIHYAIEHQKWPINHNIFCPNNFSLYQKYLTDDQPQNLGVNEFIPDQYASYLNSHLNDNI